MSLCSEKPRTKHHGTCVRVVSSVFSNQMNIIHFPDRTSDHPSLSLISAYRCPVDITWFTWLTETGEGEIDADPVDIEIEVALIWVTFLPAILNPIIYFCYLGEHRRGLLWVLSRVCPCDNSGNRRQEKAQTGATAGDEEGAPQEDLVIKETQETGML